MARRWRGVVMVEGKATGDGRFIEGEALRWNDPPLPLMWAPVGGGHDDRVIVGSIDTLTRDGGLIRGAGLLLTGIVPEADQVVPLIQRKLLGMSAELDDSTEVLQGIDADGNPVGEPMPDMGIMLGGPGDPAPEPAPPVGDVPADVPCTPDSPAWPECSIVDTQLRVQDARIRNACIVDIPAFVECIIELDGDEVPEAEPAVQAVVAAMARFQEDTPSGAMVALVPASPDALAVDGGDPPEQLHATIGYYPDGATMDDAGRQAITDAVTAWAADQGPFDATVSGWGVIGEEDPPAGVLFVEADSFESLRTVLNGTDPAPGGGHPHFTPHVTLGYGLTGDQLAAAKTATATISFDRARVAFGGDVTDLPLGGAPAAQPVAASGHTEAVLAGACCLACQQGKSCDEAETYPVPAQAAAEAKRFIGWKRAGRAGGTAVTTARAHTLAAGTAMTYAMVRRLYLSLLRLDAHRGAPGWREGDAGYPSPSRVMWAANGGETAFTWARDIIERTEGPVATYAMTAGAPEHRPRAAWFRDPQLTGPTPLTVTAEGRVYGHLAPWKSCHMSVQGYCQAPPRSKTGYAYFHQSPPILFDDGTRRRCGKITIATNHADRPHRAGPALEHYENTGACVADVVAGEDAYGIWIAGELRPGLTAEQRLATERTALSGDWRYVDGVGLELMATLGVNNPGFPVVQQLVAGGAPRTLIVAGVVEADRLDTRQPGARRATPARRRHGHDPRLGGAAEALAASIGRDRRSLVAAMAQEVHGGV